MATVRVTSVVPSRYWAPESTSSSSPGCDAAVGALGRRGSGRWRRSGRRRRWCRRRGPSARRWPRGSPPACATISISSGSVCLRLGGQPVQEARTAPRRRGAWALAGAFDLDGVLAGAGQGAGVLRAHDRGARALQLRRTTRPRTGPGSTSTRAPFSSASASGRSSGVSSVTWLPSQAGSSGVTLAGSRNSRAVPSARRIAWPSGSGRADDVAAADVEQPGDGDGRGQHRGVGAGGLQALADAGALGGAVLAGVARAGAGRRRPAAAAGRSSPQARSTGLALDGLQLGAGLGGGGLAAGRSASGLCRRGS